MTHCSAHDFVKVWSIYINLLGLGQGSKDLHRMITKPTGDCWPGPERARMVQSLESLCDILWYTSFLYMMHMLFFKWIWWHVIWYICCIWWYLFYVHIFWIWCTSNMKQNHLLRHVCLRQTWADTLPYRQGGLRHRVLWRWRGFWWRTWHRGEAVFFFVSNRCLIQNKTGSAWKSDSKPRSLFRLQGFSHVILNVIWCNLYIFVHHLPYKLVMFFAMFSPQLHRGGPMLLIDNMGPAAGLRNANSLDLRFASIVT